MSCDVPDSNRLDARPSRHHVPRGAAKKSAFLAYRPDGSVERYELRPGDAIATESQGLVHAREPVQRGERITLLAVAMKTRRKMAAERRAGLHGLVAGASAIRKA